MVQPQRVKPHDTTVSWLESWCASVLAVGINARPNILQSKLWNTPRTARVETEDPAENRQRGTSLSRFEIMENVTSCIEWLLFGSDDQIDDEKLRFDITKFRYM